MSRLEFEIRERGRVAVLILRGELDLSGTAAMEPDVEAVALDLRELEFMDSSGLRLVVLADQRLRDAGRRLLIVRGPQSVQRVFEITRTAERLEFVDAPEQVA